MGNMRKAQLIASASESMKRTTASSKVNGGIDVELGTNTQAPITCCSICKVTTSPIWWKNDEGNQLCNICYLNDGCYSKRNSP